MSIQKVSVQGATVGQLVRLAGFTGDPKEMPILELLGHVRLSKDGTHFKKAVSQTDIKTLFHALKAVLKEQGITGISKESVEEKKKDYTDKKNTKKGTLLTLDNLVKLGHELDVPLELKRDVKKEDIRDYYPALDEALSSFGSDFYKTGLKGSNEDFEKNIRGQIVNYFSKRTTDDIKALSVEKKLEIFNNDINANKYLAPIESAIKFGIAQEHVNEMDKLLNALLAVPGNKRTNHLYTAVVKPQIDEILSKVSMEWGVEAFKNAGESLALAVTKAERLGRNDTPENTIMRAILTNLPAYKTCVEDIIQSVDKHAPKIMKKLNARSNKFLGYKLAKTPEIINEEVNAFSETWEQIQNKNEKVEGKNGEKTGPNYDEACLAKYRTLAIQMLDTRIPEGLEEFSLEKDDFITTLSRNLNEKFSEKSVRTDAENVQKAWDDTLETFKKKLKTQPPSHDTMKTLNEKLNEDLRKILGDDSIQKLLYVGLDGVRDGFPKTDYYKNTNENDRQALMQKQELTFLVNTLMLRGLIVDQNNTSLFKADARDVGTLILASVNTVAAGKKTGAEVGLPILDTFMEEYHAYVARKDQVLPPLPVIEGEED